MRPVIIMRATERGDEVLKVRAARLGPAAAARSVGRREEIMEETILDGIEVIGLVGWWNGWVVVEREVGKGWRKKDRDFLAVE